MSETQETPAAPTRKRGKLIMILTLAAVLLAGGAGAFVFMSSPAQPGGKHPPKPELSEKALYMPLDPAFVVNFKNEQAMRFLQVGVTLMSHDPKAIEAAKDANPVIRNALLLLFSNQDGNTLAGADGKRKLQEQALTAVQKIVHKQTGRNGIEALYFTSFVMQ